MAARGNAKVDLTDFADAAGVCWSAHVRQPMAHGSHGRADGFTELEFHIWASSSRVDGPAGTFTHREMNKAG